MTDGRRFRILGALLKGNEKVWDIRNALELQGRSSAYLSNGPLENPSSIGKALRKFYEEGLASEKPSGKRGAEHYQITDSGKKAYEVLDSMKEEIEQVANRSITLSPTFHDAEQENLIRRLVGELGDDLYKACEEAALIVTRWVDAPSGRLGRTGLGEALSQPPSVQVIEIG